MDDPFVMRIHFQKKIHLRPILTTGRPKRVLNCMYTQHDSTIVVTDVTTFKVINVIRFESIKCFDIKDDYLVVCSVDIVVYYISSGNVVEVSCVPSVEVCIVSIDVQICSGNGRTCDVFAFAAKIDGSVSKIDVMRKVEVWLYKMAGKPIFMEVSDDTVCSTDGEELWIRRKDGVVAKYPQQGIVGIAICNSCVYSLTTDGTLTKWQKHPKIMSIEGGCDFMAESGHGFFYVSRGGVVSVYTFDGKLKYNKNMFDTNSAGYRMKGIENTSFEDESEKYSQMYGSDADMSCYEDERSSYSSMSLKGCCEQDIRDGDEDIAVCDDVVIESISHGLVLTDEQEILIVDEDLNVISTIIGNNDEIIDLKQWENVLFVATNSGRLRYTYVDYYDEGEYAFCGHVVCAHEEAIMSMSIWGNFLMTVSRDRKCILWKIFLRIEGSVRRIFLKRAKTLENNLGGVCGCALASSIFAIVECGTILQIWNYKENVFTERIHEKEINSIEVNEERRLIATSSQDKTAKMFDFNGSVVCVLKGHTKGVYSTCFGKNIVATFSADTTVRLWTMDGFSCVGVLTGHRSAVLRGSFYGNDKFLISGCVTGEVKIWNVRKKTCEINICAHKDKVWALIASKGLITSGNGSIVFFEDDTQEKANEELAIKNEKVKDSIELEKCGRNGMNARAIEILLKGNDYRLLFRMLTKCHREKFMDVFDLFNGKEGKILEMILKQGTFKNSVVIHWLLEEALKRGWKAKKSVIDGVRHIVWKHSELIDDVYSDLVGFSIFERPFG